MRFSSTKESYSEVYELLDFLGKEYIDKIPKKLYEFIEKNRDKDYRTNFNKNDIESINSVSVSRKAVAIIAFLNMNYWIDDEAEKDRLKKIYSVEQERFKDEVIENFDDELLCNCGPSLDTEENLLPIEYKEKWYMFMLNKIKNLFKRKTVEKKENS